MTPDGGINDAFANTGENAGVVLRFLVAFDRRWPTEDELAELVAPDIRFIERPNLINPGESERDAAGLRAGIETGRQPLAWQSYAVRDHIASGDSVVTRMRWSGQLASTPTLGLPRRVWLPGASPATPRSGSQRAHRAARLLRTAIAAGVVRRALVHEGWARRSADSSSMRVLSAVLVETAGNRREGMADFPYMLKAAFGRAGRARARFARPCSPATPRPRSRGVLSSWRRRATGPSPSSSGPGVSQV